MSTKNTALHHRYPDPGGNRSKEWVREFWPKEGAWKGFEEKLNQIAGGDIYKNELFQFMVNDARSMIENGCNWTAAMALLCFTEACGKLYVKTCLKECDQHARRNFQMFLTDCMSFPDGDRLAGELYRDVRCGLAHGFFLLKEAHRLEVMIGAPAGSLEDRGFEVVDVSGQQLWRFACMAYFRRFLQGLDQLQSKVNADEGMRNDGASGTKNVNPIEENEATNKSQQQLPGPLKEHHEKNVEVLLPLAKKQHEDRLNDIESLDRKLGILLIAVGGVLAAGAKLPWLRSWDDGLLGIGFLLSSAMAFLLGIIAFCVQSRKAVNFGAFRRKYTTRTQEEFNDILLSAFNESTNFNVDRNRRKGTLLNVAVLLWFAAIVFYSVESFIQ